ncbi:hypothetical protein BJ508DRAFT_83269 [Ascobolus immersus RN42]|uniref:Uncharacterized protein n=1 Tax=Ascobolus immersus RN42 TaxID=1160509 RepID=A0A3N4IEY4_ASCIM|nr:hypothetical protein BJ508DRAFT_83269 [Ascobolus immersus RN42]
MQQDRFRPRHAGPARGNSASLSGVSPTTAPGSYRQTMRGLEETWADVSSGGEDIITEGLHIAHSSQSTRTTAPVRRSLDDPLRRRRRSSVRPSSNHPRDRLTDESFLEIPSSEDDEPTAPTSEYEILPTSAGVAASQFGEFLRESDYSSSSAMLSESESEEDLPTPPQRSYTPRPPLRSFQSAPVQQQYARPAGNQHPFLSQAQQQQFDHDAALRASLSTLLSCAAAARHRGTPKEAASGPSNLAPPGVTPPPLPQRVQVESLTLLPQSALPPSVSPPQKRTPPPSTKIRSRSRSPRRRSSRRSSQNSDASTILSEVFGYADGKGGGVSTSLIALGAVVLFSVVSFSAGYALGRQQGVMEVVVEGREVRGLVGFGGRSGVTV